MPVSSDCLIFCHVGALISVCLFTTKFVKTCLAFPHVKDRFAHLIQFQKKNYTISVPKLLPTKTRFSDWSKMYRNGLKSRKKIKGGVYFCHLKVASLGHLFRSNLAFLHKSNLATLKRIGLVLQYLLGSQEQGK